MPKLLTPEHLQFLSPRRLDAVANGDETTSSLDAVSDETERRRAMSRMARFEITRRRGEVPVQDRFKAHDGHGV